MHMPSSFIRIILATSHLPSKSNCLSVPLKKTFLNFPSSKLEIYNFHVTYQMALQSYDNTSLPIHFLITPSVRAASYYYILSVCHRARCILHARYMLAEMHRKENKGF